MEPTVTAREVLQEHKSFIANPDRNWILKVIGLSIVIALGFYALILQIVDGHGITGMRDHVVWGVYIINFVYVLGISYAGALLAGVFHLARISWARPLQRILKLMTVFALIIGPIYILLCIGRLDRLFNLFFLPRIQSPIIWDLIAVMTDLIFCIFYIYITYIKDFAIIRDHAKELDLPEWRQKLYSFFAMGYNDTPAQKKNLNFALDVMAAIIIPTSIVAYSLLAWLFGMNLKVGWNSSIMAPYFVLTAIYSGVACLIFIMWIYRKSQNLHKTFTDEHFTYLGFALVVLSLFYGYFYFSEYLTDWYNMSNTYKAIWAKIFDFSQYGWMFAIGITLTTAIPVIVILFPWFRTINSIAITSVLVLIGLWLMRYIMIVPVLETPYIPIQDARPEYFSYSATWIEWVLSATGVAAFILLFMFAAKLAPIVPVSEMLEEKEEHKLTAFFRLKKKLTTSKS